MQTKTAGRDAGRPLLSLFGNGPVAPERSQRMSRVKGKDTQPELEIRRRVWALGGRYRCHSRTVPGRPDLSNQRAKVAVFIDGCFWHGCPAHFRVPRTRTAFWTEKIRRNVARRETVRQELSGWSVLEFYECQVKAGPDEIARRVSKLLTDRGGSGRWAHGSVPL